MAGVLLASIGGAAAEPFELRRPLGLIEPDIPLDRPLTRELVDLGKKLFFEPTLSRSKTTSCATCHDPAFGYADPRSVSVNDNGLPQKRNAPSLYNVGFLPTLMWDGRFRSLEQQAPDTFKNNGDMGQDIDDAVAAIATLPEYPALFQAALGSVPTADGLARALAAFQRTLVSGDSPFDQFLFGNDSSALNETEQKGLDVFSNKAGCLNCHDVFHPRFNALGGGVALFTDFRFHNLGVGYRLGGFSDGGRYLWSRDATEWGSFRTPPIRNLTLTAPYMHNGSLNSLEEVVDFYNRGGNLNSNLSPSIHPLFLTSIEKQQLVAFLKSLTDPEAAKLGIASKPQPRPSVPSFAKPYSSLKELISSER